MTHISNQRGDITTNSKDIKSMIKKCYFKKQRYANKFKNLDKMDKFPERHKLLQLTHEKIDVLNHLLSVE